MPEESREGRQRFGVVRGTSALVSVPSSRAFKFHRMSWQEECDTDEVLRETEDFKTAQEMCADAKGFLCTLHHSPPCSRAVQHISALAMNTTQI